MTKRMIIMLVAVGVLFGGLFGFKAFLGVKIREGIAAKGLPAQTISTAKAQFMEWQGEFQAVGTLRSEEHTSELQSRLHLVCRLLLEKKKTLDTRDGNAVLCTDRS